MHKHVKQTTHTSSINYSRETTLNSLTCISLKLLDMTAMSRLSNAITEENTYMDFAESVGHDSNWQVKQHGY